MKSSSSLIAVAALWMAFTPGCGKSKNPNDASPFGYSKTTCTAALLAYRDGGTKGASSEMPGFGSGGAGDNKEGRCSLHTSFRTDDAPELVTAYYRRKFPDFVPAYESSTGLDSLLVARHPAKATLHVTATKDGAYGTSVVVIAVSDRLD